MGNCIMSEKDKIKELERITNEYLDAVRELEYTLEHFIRKTNKTTALNVRNTSRVVERLKKEFKRISIEIFNKKK